MKGVSGRILLPVAGGTELLHVALQEIFLLLIGPMREMTSVAGEKDLRFRCHRKIFRYLNA